MPLLAVDLRTDYLPGTDFGHAEVIVARAEAGQRRYTQYFLHTASSGTDYSASARIAEFAQVDDDHPYSLVVKLLDSRGRTVDFRVLRVDVRDRDLVVTSLIARS
ncbi:MAG: hypothetical protein ACR2QM_17465 [Longimicrobiales bacterium]